MKLFKGNNQSSSKLSKVDYFDYKKELSSKLQEEISAIDKELASLLKSLWEAQKVLIKSAISTSNGFFSGFQKKVYTSAANESVSWHKERIKYLYVKRQELQRSLDKVQGQYWKKKLRFFVLISSAIIIGVVVLYFLALGLMFALYLLPLVVIISLFYALFRKLSSR